jgi:hypothetical protein
MAKTRSEIETAAGKLTSAIQKVWSNEAGEPEAKDSEEVLHQSHDLIQAAKCDRIDEVLNGRL